MKKILSLALVSGLFAGVVSADLVSIDSLRMLQESKEGKVLAENLQTDIKKFQEEVVGAQSEVAQLQEKIQKQAKLLSKEALMEKGEELTKIKKRAERDLADKEEALKLKVQREQTKLRDKQLTIAKKVFDDKKWGMMIDKNTPGVLFVNSAVDKTDELLKVVDEAFTKEAAANVVSKTTKKVIKAA